MVQEAVKKLSLLGQMPDELDDNISSEQIDQYSDLLDQVVQPINVEEGELLILLFPPVALYGIEWALLHVIESLYGQGITDEAYKTLIEKCPSDESRQLLLTRLANGKRV